MKFTCAILSIAAVSALKLQSEDYGDEPAFNVAVKSYNKAKGADGNCVAGDTATVHYTGKLASNGKVFDSSV